MQKKEAAKFSAHGNQMLWPEAEQGMPKSNERMREEGEQADRWWSGSASWSRLQHLMLGMAVVALS